MRLPIPPPRQGRRDFRSRPLRVSKKKAKRTALRRRNRAERDEQLPTRAASSRALNAARAPLTADELAARLRVARHARREFERALARARARRRHRAEPRRQPAGREAHRAGRRARRRPSRRPRLPRARRRRRVDLPAAGGDAPAHARRPRRGARHRPRPSRPRRRRDRRGARARATAASSGACTPSTACCSSCPRTGASRTTSWCRRPRRARPSPARW